MVPDVERLERVNDRGKGDSDSVRLERVPDRGKGDRDTVRLERVGDLGIGDGDSERLVIDVVRLTGVCVGLQAVAVGDASGEGKAVGLVAVGVGVASATTSTASHKATKHSLAIFLRPSPNCRTYTTEFSPREGNR